MLVNGAKLGYKKKTDAEGEYTDLPGLKEVPDIGVEPEKVENTCLTDKNKQYENGIGDLGDMKYKFKYDNSKVDSPYRVLRKAADNGDVLSFKETLKDGTTIAYDAQPSVKMTGGGVNGVVEFELTVAVQSDLTYTDGGQVGSSDSADAVTLTEIIENMYEDALDCGISPAAFWGNSIAENLDIMASYQRNQRRRRKDAIMDCFLLARITAEQHPMTEKENLTMPWDVYPTLFVDEKADFEKEKEAAELENYKAAWRQRVKKFNAQRHKEEEVDT